MQPKANQSLIETAVVQLTPDERLDYIVLTEAITGMADAFKAHYLAVESENDRAARLSSIQENLSNLMNKVLSTPLLESAQSGFAGLDQRLFNCSRWIKKTYFSGAHESARKQSCAQILAGIKEAEVAVFGTVAGADGPACPRDFCVTEQGACIPCIGN